MQKPLSALLLSAALAGCASDGQPLGGSRAAEQTAAGIAIGAAAGNVLGRATGMDRTAATIVGAAVGGAIGYQRGKAMDARTAAQEAERLRAATGFEPTVSTQRVAVARDGSEIESLRTLEMPIPRNEMLTEQGALRPRAAQALQRMDDMAQAHGADFSVYVPDDATFTLDELERAAPHATIYRVDRATDFRLVITPST